MFFTKRNLIILLLLLSGGVWWFGRSVKTTITVDQLSPRAQEFITDQRSDGTGLWNQVNLETSPQPTANQTTIVTECFSLTVPFRTSNPNQSFEHNRCVWRAKVVSPLSYLTLSSTKVSDFENESGITLRRKDPTKYTEINLNAENFSEIAAFRSDTEVIVFAAQNQQLLTLAFTELAQPTALAETEILALLKAVKLKPLPEVTLSPTP